MVTFLPPTVPVAVSGGLAGAGFDPAWPPPCANTVPAAAKSAVQTNKRFMQILLDLGTTSGLPMRRHCFMGWSTPFAGMIVASTPPVWELYTRRCYHAVKSLPMSNAASPQSPGLRFRAAVADERPLQVAGAINAYTARLAQASGFRAIYLSGGGVAANSLGLPDLGISTMEDVLIDVRRITDASSVPLLVDIDTGWGSAFNIARTIRSMIKAGAAAVPT